MPVTPTYPGVYIEEVPSGVRTISGIATSVAAFIGWSAKGPIDQAERVLSWADFERKFGGLDTRSYLGYSVYQFFANGGQDTYVIRLASDSVASSALPAANTLAAGGTDVLDVTAVNPGGWANEYGISIRQRSDDVTRFQFDVVLLSGNSVVESFANLSMDSSDRRFVEAVINQQSAFVDVSIDPQPPGATPAPPDDIVADPLTGGDDGEVLEPNTAAFETALALSSASGGVNFLDRVDLFNLLAVPGESNALILQSLQAFCHDRRAFLIADCPQNANFGTLNSGLGNITGASSINSAFYFPWINAPDPMQENRIRDFPPSGFVAGIYSKTDVTRGVFKAPAGTEASLTGVAGAAQKLTDQENGILNVQAINCIRDLKVYGTVVWGARTLAGNNERGSEWKYVPVRRIALFIEESLYRGTQWVVFEPNDEPLWAQIRLNIGSFMHNLFRQGAFQGTTPQQAYFVKCDKETTTQADINRGIVNIIVGFAPLKPAEFVVVQIQQISENLET